MKGIILAGGNGSRLMPITKSYSKQLVPIYDKPLIFYPLCTLMEANISDILIISSSNQINNFKFLLGDGKKIGLNISYLVQENPNGIAEAFIIGEDFIKGESVTLILGDNIFHGHDIGNEFLKNSPISGGLVFIYQVPDPERYGVVEINKDNKIISIEEKPKNPKSSLVITGLYVYDNNIINIAKDIKPSLRNELEITDINNIYLRNNRLNFCMLSNSSVWFDAGTPLSLLQSSQYVQAIQERQKKLIASPEIIAFQKKLIDFEQYKSIANNYEESDYGDYLRNFIIAK
mgnify:CR=1 FL=1